MKILVLEDDLRVSELVARGFKEGGYEVETVYDGLAARKEIWRQRYDLLIMDIIVPHLNGLELCIEVRRVFPHIPIIMLTALGTTDDKVEGFDAGADDYLVKPFEMRELLARSRALLKRKALRATTANRLAYSDLFLDKDTKSVYRGDTLIRLTPKEYNLLAYFLEHPERVICRTEIAENVWETHFDTGTNFIDVYINYLRKKIDRDFSRKLIHTKPGMGFMLIDESLEF